MTELANIQYQAFTGAGAIAEALAPGVKFRLLRIEFHFSAAPTTSEDLTVTLDAGDGSTYDTLQDTQDPSVDSLTDLILGYGDGYEFEADDEVDIAYANSDTATITGRYVYETPK